jgi:hypothetical protein
VLNDQVDYCCTINKYTQLVSRDFVKCKQRNKTFTDAGASL